MPEMIFFGNLLQFGDISKLQGRKSEKTGKYKPQIDTMNTDKIMELRILSDGC